MKKGGGEARGNDRPYEALIKKTPMVKDQERKHKRRAARTLGLQKARKTGGGRNQSLRERETLKEDLPSHLLGNKNQMNSRV